MTLWLMGSAVGPAEAILLESLSLGARSAAFLVPSGWGAQEAALIALAVATGLPAETALALGLVKRAREFSVGLPGLLAWALVERRVPGAPAPQRPAAQQAINGYRRVENDPGISERNPESLSEQAPEWGDVPQS